MSASPSGSLDAAARALVLRHVQTLITKTLAFFAERQDDHLKRLRSHFFEQVDARPHTTQAQNLRTAGVMLDKNAAQFNRAFQAALRESIEEQLDSVVPGIFGTLRSAESSGPRSLALLDVDEIERHLLVDRVAQAFNARYESKLMPLTQCVGVLLRQEDFSFSDNPFRPAALIHAFSIAWYNSEFDPAAAEDFVSALEPGSSIDWAPLYASLTETLVRAGFSAQQVHRIKRTAGGDTALAPSQHGRETAGAAKSSFGGLESGSPRSGFAGPETEPARSKWTDLAPAAGRSIAAHARQFLQKLGVGRPADGSGAGEGGGGDGHGPMADGGAAAAAQVPADPAFMGYLGGLQAGAWASPAHPWVPGQDLGDQNLLRELRDRDEVKSAPELDRGTVDALVEVFDFVFADKAIPTQLKVVIGRLQIPVLRAAMIDRDFFLTPDHPARKLVDALAAASVGWMPEKGETDPLYVRIETTVKRVLTEFEDDLELFAHLLADFNGFLQDAERKAQVHIEPAASEEQQREALDLALAHVDDVVYQCIDAQPPGEPLLPFLVPFLTSQWRDVMARAWMNQAATPSEWEEALGTMDQVIWSTQPKGSGAERARLVAVLPDLVRKLNASLDAIGWSGEERNGFMRSLIDTHMKAIRAPKTGPAPLESGPGEVESRAGNEAMKALERRRTLHQAGEADEFDAMAQAFTRAMWFEFADDQGVRRRYRLSWVSPQRTRLLFTNRDGFEAFVHSEKEVAGLLREGRLVVIDQEAIVTRAIEQIMAAAGQAEIDMELV